jgi:superfamily II DNA/RNA helicase
MTAIHSSNYVHSCLLYLVLAFKYCGLWLSLTQATSNQSISFEFDDGGKSVQALENKGIKALFPIQKSVFDPAMAGSDLVARARTGSGKTLAFSLPIIESILKENAENGAGRGPRAPRALILAPTRELAKQVAGELQSAAMPGALSVCTVYGGTPIGGQIRDIQRGVDVLVGTPGRTIDLVQTRKCVPSTRKHSCGILVVMSWIRN